MKNKFLVILVFCWTVSILLKAQLPESSINGRLIMKSGFEQGVSVTDDMRSLSGGDVEGYAWDEPRSWVKSTRFAYLVTPGKNLSEYMESVIETMNGPRGKPSRVLRLTNKADDPDNGSTSRNEYSFFSKDTGGFEQGYVRYYMKLQPNLGEIIPWNDSNNFYMIMEWKEPNSRKRGDAAYCLECCNAKAGGTNNYRINIGLIKDACSTDLYWMIRGEQPQPCRVEEWQYVNRSVKVPVGEWFLVEAYLKKHSGQGRVYFAVNSQVILDTNHTRPDGFTGSTQHKSNPLPLHFWSPMKNYHAMDWNQQGPVSQWYDDFELWDGFPSGHPAVNNQSGNHDN